MKKALLITGGVCWLLFASGFAFFAIQFVFRGSGLEFLSLPIFGGIILRLLQFLGMVALSATSFAISLGLFAHDFVAGDGQKRNNIATGS